MALLLAACTSGPSTTPTPSALGPGWLSQGTGELVPVVVSSELAVGPNRFLVNLVDRQNEPQAAADRPARLDFYDLAASTSAPAVSVAGTYMVILETLPGIYRAPVEFARAGEWGLELITTEPDGSQRRGRVAFSVRPTSSTPAIGAAAVPSDTPTAATAEEIAAISTDRQPDADFYRLSVDQALTERQPFMLVFATPAFCRTATCGPALEVVKSVAPDYKESVAFIHVEPYQLRPSGDQLQPVLDQNNNPIPVQAVLDWGLVTEPYIFAVDAEGKVRAKLEGVAGQDELRQALDLISG